MGVKVLPEFPAGPTSSQLALPELYTPHDPVPRQLQRESLRNQVPAGAALPGVVGTLELGYVDEVVDDDDATVEDVEDDEPDRTTVDDVDDDVELFRGAVVAVVEPVVDAVVVEEPVTTVVAGGVVGGISVVSTIELGAVTSDSAPSAQL
jgi:hypothetical protein